MARVTTHNGSNRRLRMVTIDSESEFRPDRLASIAEESRHLHQLMLESMAKLSLRLDRIEERLEKTPTLKVISKSKVQKNQEAPKGLSN